MGEPAKVLKVRDQQKPDLMKPVSLHYWSLPNGEYFGNGTTRMAMVGNDFTDSTGVSGRVTEITMYPSGAVIIEVQPMQLQPVEEQPSRRHVVCMGPAHGASMTIEILDGLMKAGKLT